MKVKENFCSYTVDFNHEDAKKMGEEIIELKTELDKTRNLVRMQRIRYQQLILLFQAKLQEKEEEARIDLQTKHVQLTNILRSLYILEAKLRKEQRSLKVLLGERDALVKTQELEIIKLRNQLEKFSNGQCICNVAASKTFDKSEQKRCEQDNKPDLISSIGIEILQSDNSPPSSTTHLETEAANTYVIASLDNYDASWSTLHVRGISVDANVVGIDEQNSNNENIRNCMLNEEQQNEMHKLKKKEETQTHFNETFKINSPRMILKEVTENPNDKLNGPVLSCIKQILSQDGNVRKQEKRKQTKSDEVHDQRSYRCHPVKPPKPLLLPNLVHPYIVRNENNNSCNTLCDNMLHIKQLPKLESQQHLSVEETIDAKSSEVHPQITVSALSCMNKDKGEEEKIIGSDESKIVLTVSAVLSDSADSEDEQTKETSPTVSQMVKKFEELKSQKKLINAKQSNPAVHIISKTDSMMFQTNFEEFHLVDKEIDSTCEVIAKDNVIRLEAEGQENHVEDINESKSSTTMLSSTCPSSNAKYEAFLEVTGLCQKSILTPSRILSNHRNVIKPKDVKYRSRVKAAAGITDRCISNENTITSPTMRYWSEPYL